MLYIWMGRAKTGKSRRVLEKIRELGEENINGRQILLVPEHASHEAEVDLCRVCGDTASRHAEVLSFRRLCNRVLSRTGGIADIPLDAGGKLLMLQRCVNEVSATLKVYQRPSRRPAFLVRLLDLFDELSAYEATPEILLEKAGELSDGATRDKLSDLGLLYGAYEAKLRENNRDSRDLMSRLKDNLRYSDYISGKDIFLDGFSYFNAQERDILKIMLKQARSVTVVLLGEPDSQEEIFEPAVKTMGRLKRMAAEAGQDVKIKIFKSEIAGPLGYLERYFFSNYNKIYNGAAADNIKLREAETILNETEQAAAEIVKLVSSGKARYKDITVSARNMEDYAACIETVLKRWGIPAYWSRRTDLMEKPVLCLITGVLSSIINGYEYEDMFRWLKSGLAGFSPEECDILENYVIRWEIRGSMWTREEDWKEHPDGYGAEWSEYDQERLKNINDLRGRIREILLNLSTGLKSGGTVREKTDKLYDFIEKLNLTERLNERMKARADAGELQEAEETAQIWEILCGVLDQFVELLGDERMNAEDYIRLLKQALTQYSIGTVPVSLDQVSISEITRNDRHTVKYLFLLGCNDDKIPAAGQSGGILNRDDRETLAGLGLELSPAGQERMSLELQMLYAALAQPEDGLYISWTRTDASGGEARPAFVISRIQALFADIEIEREDIKKSWRLTAAIPALEMAGNDKNSKLWRYFEKQSKYADKINGMKRASGLKRGALSGQAVRKLYGGRLYLSASRLERMRSCHFAYFMRYGLKAKSRTAAEFDAPQIGSFLHFLLENVTREVLSRGGFSKIDDEKLKILTDEYINKFIEQEFGDLSAKNARFKYLFQRLRRTARNVILEAAEELRHSDFVPVAYELGFGDGESVPAVIIRDDINGQLRIRGRVDRADGWVRNGKLYLRVVDYKSGKKKFDLSAVRMGLDIQMLLYLFALESAGKTGIKNNIENLNNKPENNGDLDNNQENVSGGNLNNLNWNEIVPAGVLYFPARDEILNADRDITPEKLNEMREKNLKRSGLLLSDPEVLSAMEHEALTEPRYLPLKVSKKDGTVSGGLASAENLGKLKKYLGKLLREIGRELREGCIDADPCRKSGQDDPCAYCEWFDACYFADGRDTDRYRPVGNIKPEEFWKMLDSMESAGDLK